MGRRSHGGYIRRYPLGLDAAVARGTGFKQTMAFRNDSAESIVVTVRTPGTARVDVYAAAPLDRWVEFSTPRISHRLRAGDRTVPTATLVRGQSKRVQPASDGMTVSIARIVRDGRGRLLHRDRWVSVYRQLDGLVRVGTG